MRRYHLTEFIMQLCNTPILRVAAVACTGQVAGIPLATLPAANHSRRADHAAPSKAISDGQRCDSFMGSSRKLIVGTDPAQPQVGSPTKLVMQIQDDDGTPITRFDAWHSTLVYLIVVHEGLDEIAHLHPEVDASGMITIEFAFPMVGRYRLIVEHQPRGKSPARAEGQLVVHGDKEPTASLMPNASNEIKVDALTAHITTMPGNRETAGCFQFIDSSSQAVGDLQPRLEAKGHLAIVSEEGRANAHAYSQGETKTDSAGTVEFSGRLPKRGIYKAWDQLQREESVFAVPFVIEHIRGTPLSPAGGH